MKAMTDNGYDRSFSAALTSSAACIGPVIPPSIPFVLYGTIAEVSILHLRFFSPF
jgi:TRAP-type C4-dicarboxylate transport system permease large subunit